MLSPSPSQTPSPNPSPPPPHKKQKKRKAIEHEGDELEIDVNLPEPPSKKAKRKEAKKGKSGSRTKNSVTAVDAGSADAAQAAENSVHAERKFLVTEPGSQKADVAEDGKGKRSEYGIWIGNLAFFTSRDNLRTFLREQGSISDHDISRIHMPAAVEKGPKVAVKPQNKGFAYVDFATADVLGKALGLSEKLLGGRRVLIKNAKSFEGRPDKAKVEEGSGLDGNAKSSHKEATKRIFVGNLSFDVSKDDLHEHFAQAGEVEDVHMATFEDSGKCKGFAWIRFCTVDAAKAAVDGYIYKSPQKEDSNAEEEIEDGENGEEMGKKKKKSKKPQKWFINRLFGRPLRCEFAEDAQTRYKKRFGSDRKTVNPTNHDTPFHNDSGAALQSFADEAPVVDAAVAKKSSKDERQDARRKRHEAKRSSAPMHEVNGKASGTAVMATGKKITFD